MWAIAVCSGKSVPAEQAPTTGSALPTSGQEGPRVEEVSVEVQKVVICTKFSMLLKERT